MIVEWFWNSHATMNRSLINRPVQIYTIFSPSSYKYSSTLSMFCDAISDFCAFGKRFTEIFFCPARKMPKLPLSHSRTFLTVSLPFSLSHICLSSSITSSSTSSLSSKMGQACIWSIISYSIGVEAALLALGF